MNTDALRRDSLRGVKGRLALLGREARKGLGQHFLVDSGALKTMADAAELNAEDVVLEVGPGLGGLTRVLASRAGKVLAIELDAELSRYLREDFKERPNVEVIEADVLGLDLDGLLSQSLGDGRAFLQYKVVAALPYFIAAPTIRRFLEMPSKKPQLMVVTVQREMAENIVARPGGMSLISVAVQLYGRPKVVDYLPPRSFHPRPKVESAILRIDVYPEPVVPILSPQLFFKVVKAGFSSRRKQLHNALSNALGELPSDCSQWLMEAGIEPSRRAETLSLEEWSRLHMVVTKARQSPVIAYADLSDAR